MVLHYMLFSVDVETDGDSPAVSSMLSLGAVALLADTFDNSDTFYANLHRRPGAQPLNSTMSEFWDMHPYAYTRARADLREPEAVIREFDDWVRRTVKEEAKRLKAAGKIASGDGLEPKFLAYPGGFDWTWVAHYMHLYLGQCAFGFAPFDMGSYAAGVLKDEGVDFSPASRLHKTKWPAEWLDGLPLNLPHHALEDAEIQAEIFRRMVGIQPNKRAPGEAT